MSELYTGVRVHEVAKEIVDELYKNKEIEIWDKRFNWFQNQFIVVKSGQGSALTVVKNNHLVLLKTDISVSGIKPRNKEQTMALSALMDDDIKVVAMTGAAGTGKTLLALSTALQKIDDGTYKRLILTRPMSWVGKHGLGALPGDVDEKFGPYLENYVSNLEIMVGGKKKVKDAMLQYQMEFLPLQLIRGVSFHDTFIIADEVQTLDHHEMLTLGTRVAEGSKLIIMGDLDQRDEKIAKEKTGIYKFINNSLAQNSPIVSSIHLIKCERSETARLFAEVFK
jgi:PhoH-like ATPase